MTQFNTTVPTTPTTEEGIPVNPNSEQFRQVQAGLCLVKVTVRSPDYRVAIRSAKIEAQNEAGEMEIVDQSKISKGGWIWNIHPIFGEVAKNRQDIGLLLDSYSVPDRLTESTGRAGGGGLRLMPILKFPEFFRRLQDLIDARTALVTQLADVWLSEVIPGLHDHFGTQFYQVRPGLPASPNDLHRRFEVICQPPLPLTPISPDQMDITALSPADRDRFIRGQQDLVNQMFQQRFAAVFDTVLGGLNDLAMDVMYGPIDPASGRRTGKSTIMSGRRRTGAVEEMLSLLDRAVAFKDVTNLTPDMLALLNDARSQLHGLTYEDLNANHGNNPTTQAIKQSMTELGVAVQRLMANNGGRARRAIAI